MSRRWTPLRVPAFWILLAVIGAVSLLVLSIAAVLLSHTPRAAAVTVPAVLVYAALWLAVVLRLADPIKCRPVWLVSMAVAWGATVACAVGLSAGVYLDNILAKAVSPSFAAEWGPALTAPMAEETAKAAGVVLLLLAARPYLRSVWSCAVYGALVGVGFAAIEDAAYAVMHADMVLADDVKAAAQLLWFRFSTPGLVGHPVFSAVAGAGVGYAWLRADQSWGRRLAVAAAAVGGSCVMHAAVNSPVAAQAAATLGGFGWAAGWAAYVLVVTVAAVPGLYWLTVVRRREAGLLLGHAVALLPEAARGEDGSGGVRIPECPYPRAPCGPGGAVDAPAPERGQVG